MRVVVPADTKSLDSVVCPSFGRAPHYLIYDTESKIVQFIDNPAAHSQGGAGIQASQFLLDQQIQAVLAPRCGKNAAEVLQAAGINIYKSINGSIQENLLLLQAEKLELLEEIHAGFHRHGGR